MKNDQNHRKIYEGLQIGSGFRKLEMFLQPCGSHGNTGSYRNLGNRTILPVNKLHKMDGLRATAFAFNSVQSFKEFYHKMFKET